MSEALVQVGLLLKDDHLKLGDGGSDQRDRMSKAETITVQLGRLSSLKHEHAHRVVGEQDAVEFLDDPLGG